MLAANDWASRRTQFTISTSPRNTVLPDCAKATRSRLLVGLLRISHVLLPVKIKSNHSCFKVSALTGLAMIFAAAGLEVVEGGGVSCGAVVQ